MKLKSFFTFSLIAVIAIGLIGCKSSNTPKTSADSNLRLKFNAGEVYTITSTIDQDIAQEIPDQPIKFHQTIQMGLNCLVKSVDTDGNYNLDVTYQSLMYKITGLLQPIDYDSKAADNKDFPLAGLVGQTYQVTLAPNGKILDVQGADQIVDRLVDDIQAQVPAEVKSLLSKDALKYQFGDKATQEMMMNVICTFPDHRVENGDHWQQEFALKYGYPVKINTEYTLEKSNAQVATIDVKSSRTPLADAPAMTVGNISFSYELNGQDTGKIEVDAKTGWITNATINSKLTGKVIIAPTQDLPEGLTWPITVDGVVALKGEGPLSQ